MLVVGWVAARPGPRWPAEHLRRGLEALPNLVVVPRFSIEDGAEVLLENVAPQPHALIFAQVQHPAAGSVGALRREGLALWGEVDVGVVAGGTREARIQLVRGDGELPREPVCGVLENEGLVTLDLAGAPESLDGSHVRNVCVQLPERRPRQPIPVVVLFPPFGVAFEREAHIALSSYAHMSAELESDAIIVLIDTATPQGVAPVLGESSTRSWATLVDRVLGEVETRFSVRADRDGRTIIGSSAGASVALSVAMARPETFGRVAVHAPYGASLSAWLVSGDGENARIREDLRALVAFESQMPGMGIARGLAAECCSSPDCALFDTTTWSISPELARCNRWSASERAQELAPFAYRMFLSCGIADELGAWRGCEALSAAMRNASIPHVLALTDATHDDIEERGWDDLWRWVLSAPPPTPLAD